MLLGKIHRTVVTEANLDYVGSITIDRALFVAAGLLEYERVQVVNINNGNHQHFQLSPPELAGQC